MLIIVHQAAQYAKPATQLAKDNNRKGYTFMDEDDDYYYEKNSATSLLDSWKRGQQQVNSFWEVWRNEYLLSLRERYSMFHRKEKNQIESIPQVGQVVIIKEERIPIEGTGNLE